MNILFVTQWYPNREQPFFGIFVREHARAVQSAGHKVQVLALSLHRSKKLFHKKIYHYTDESGIRTTQCELHSRLKDLLYHLPRLQFYFLKKAYREECGQEKFDLVHSQVIYPAGIWGHSLAEQLKIPHIITEHWSRLADFSKGSYVGIARKAYSSAGAILPVSAFLKQNIQRVFPELNEQAFTIVGNVVDNTCFFYKTPEKQPNELTFCAIATWQHKKKPDKIPELFIEALSQLQKNESRKIKLVMVGGGNKVADLKQACVNANINARFTGYLSKEKIAEELHQVDYFVHASTIETFSIVVAEALACGVPVISSNTGALPELIDSDNGLVCENTLQAWTETLQKATTTAYDRKQIAEKLQQRFSRESIGKKIAAIYSSVGGDH